jgi:hypothetical protein
VSVCSKEVIESIKDSIEEVTTKPKKKSTIYSLEEATGSPSYLFLSITASVSILLLKSLVATFQR